MGSARVCVLEGEREKGEDSGSSQGHSFWQPLSRYVCYPYVLLNAGAPAQPALLCPPCRLPYALPVRTAPFTAVHPQASCRWCGCSRPCRRRCCATAESTRSPCRWGACVRARMPGRVLRAWGGATDCVSGRVGDPRRLTRLRRHRGLGIRCHAVTCSRLSVHIIYRIVRFHSPFVVT